MEMQNQSCIDFMYVLQILHTFNTFKFIFLYFSFHICVHRQLEPNRVKGMYVVPGSKFQVDYLPQIHQNILEIKHKFCPFSLHSMYNNAQAFSLCYLSVDSHTLLSCQVTGKYLPVVDGICFYLTSNRRQLYSPSVVATQLFFYYTTAK